MPDLADVYRDKSPSLATKATLAALHLMIVAVVWWLLLGGGLGSVDGWLGRGERQSATDFRLGLLAAAAALYFLRTVATLFVFMKRRMPWSEVATIAVWVGIIDLTFAYFGGRASAPVGRWEAIGVLLLLAGSAINTGSEWQRNRWKQRPENAGRVYTGGLFRFARHINYFGDEVLFTGWVLLTATPALLIVPVLMACGFIFLNIPAQNRYLEDRYGDEYRVYARRVKRFVPYVY